MAEHADVRIRVALLIEEVDNNGRASRLTATDDHASGLLQVRIEPRKEGGKRAGVEHALALQAVEGDWSRGQVGVEHPESAGPELAENRTRRGLNAGYGGLEVGARRRGQSQIDGRMEGLVLARGQASLQLFR